MFYECFTNNRGPLIMYACTHARMHSLTPGTSHSHKFKMSRTLQQLRTDVNSLQSTLKELHSLLKISPDAIKVPSWRYPEKMATSVRVQVKECEDHQLLLELLVDR